MVCEARLKRVLQAGGMLVVAGGFGRLYRSRDARRGLVGQVDLAIVDSLRAGGAVRLSVGAGVRYIWAGAGDTHTKAQREVTPPKARSVDRARRKRARSALELILSGAKSEAEKAYLAQGAARFMREVEASGAGQSVTMNWAFVPQRAKQASYTGGASLISVAAKRSLEALGARLGGADTGFLERLLIEQASLPKMMEVYALSRAACIGHALGALKRLAHAYDYSLAPEFGADLGRGGASD